MIARALRSVARYVVLPREVTPFERAHLAKTNKLALAFFALHVPAIALLALFNDTGPLAALALTVLVLVGPVVAHVTFEHPRAVSVVHGVTATAMGALLVHFGQGPTQIEMHFYFFAVIAMLAVFGNPLVILAAAGTVAAHHLLLFFVLPRSVFNYDAPLWVVAIHACFVCLESIGAVYMARSFFDNVIELEAVVVQRTARMRQRHADMRLVLDNVEQGFVTIDRQGHMTRERSAWFDDRFGREARGDTTATIFDLFERRSRDYAARARFAWEQVADDMLPLSVALAQMPTTLMDGSRTFEVSYRPIGEAETPNRFLVVVVDVTAAKAAEAADLERREALTLLERAATDRCSFLDFLEDAGDLVTRLVSHAEEEQDLVCFQRAVHTLKGNAAVFGLGSVADLCHEIEDVVAVERQVPRDALARLARRWSRISRDVERLVMVQRDVVTIQRDAFNALEDAVRLRMPHKMLLETLRALRFEPVHRRFEAYAEQAQRIAARLGKRVRVDIDAGDVRLDPRRFGPFWSAFVHAVRNAVDHGIEPSDERASHGKPAEGHLVLRCSASGDETVIEIADDGRGIDWERVAAEAGRPGATREELVDLLLRGGISTADAVTDLSGRGIGMGALVEAAEQQRARVVLDTEKGRGTRLRFVFPNASERASGGPARGQTSRSVA